MNKEQIEEMAKVLPDTLPDWFDKNRKIILSKSLKTQIAKEYYNAGYRKESETVKELLINIKRILEKDDYDYYYFEWVGIAKKYGVEEIK